MRHRVSGFADCFLHSRFRYFRLVLFSSMAIVVFLSLWSISGHPLTNRNVLTDTEVDDLFRLCHSRGQDANDPYLGIFIPFDSSQIDLIRLKLNVWLELDLCPCNVTSRGAETNRSDIIFFFLGDPIRHSNLFSQLLKSLDSPSLPSIRSCFKRILFKSLRDLELPSAITLSDLFYGVVTSELLRSYTHTIWMDASVSPVRAMWVAALHSTLPGEPFWVLGAMTSSKRHDHFDRSHYHMHMNAVYRTSDPCFIEYIRRVRDEYRGTTPDLAMHLYRTDYANFREAQHTQHLFRYSRLFIALDTPMSVRPNIKKEDWPGTYLLIQDRHYARFGRNAVIARREGDGKAVEVVKEEIKEGDGDADKERPNIVQNEVKDERK
jgi:hypothetical protein